MFRKPRGITVSPGGECIMVSDEKSGLIYKFDFDGNVNLAFGSEKGRKGKDFNKPSGLVFDGSGNLFIANRNHNRMEKFGLPGEMPITVVSSDKQDEKENKKGMRLSALTSATGPDSSFKLGEVYAFPNPAKRQNPTLHIEVGIADSVEIRIYDIAGDLAHETRLTGMPQIIDDGQGPQYAYEYTWNISGVGSGVYIYAIRARKEKQDIRSVGKCAVIK